MTLFGITVILQLLLLLYVLKFSLCESFFFGALISLRVQKKRIELILIHIPVVKGGREKRSLTRKFGDVSYPLAKKPRGGGGGGESKASKITIQWMTHQGPGPSLNHVARNNTPASAYNIRAYARCVHAFHSFEERIARNLCIRLRPKFVQRHYCHVSGLLFI